LTPEVLGGNGIVADYKRARFTDAEALYSCEKTYQMQNLIVAKPSPGSSPLCGRRSHQLDHALTNDVAPLILDQRWKARPASSLASVTEQSSCV
jgi:hypothetical protein